MNNKSVIFYKKPADNWPWITDLSKLKLKYNFKIISHIPKITTEIVGIFAIRAIDKIFLIKAKPTKVLYIPHCYTFRNRSRSLTSTLRRIFHEPSQLFTQLESKISRRIKVNEVEVFLPYFYSKSQVKKDLKNILKYEKIIFHEIPQLDELSKGLMNYSQNTLLIIDQPLVSDGATTLKKLHYYIKILCESSKNKNLEIILYLHPRSDGSFQKVFKKLSISFSTTKTMIKPEKCFTFSSTLSLLLKNDTDFLIPPDFSSESKELANILNSKWPL